ncbi:acyl-CoA thioesterase [Pusillimonas noertemannii]|uniref:Acyl-CoA thioester hydrolase n=1 Tax=Pusillimonas noertemannii TaxID=305977 RepID=A0A2U1CSD0_9BURK|nr:acyl-CoA thioesterase [Pusillimonas noertemannii]NYT68096.1 acyl-CoA thioesterase [Pusillimonas noertemannii]PVY68773.1 acyl-CoA thioester hydrolase [Pusillimonas noertemannii]TFL11771.1 acyl-CoA thioesterase [Pusillimonas noertemannii]
MLQDAASAIPRIGHVFECVIPVRWGDQDALHHVNNTVYFRYSEEARALLYMQAGFPVPGEREAVLAHASCDFLKPLMYPATVVVRLEFKRLGRSSMEYDFIIERQDEPGVVYARGKNITVNTDARTGKSCAWSEPELAGYARCFVAPGGQLREP